METTRLLSFEKAPKSTGKKYYAVLENKKTGQTKEVAFGALKPNGEPYAQYKDRTGVGEFSAYDHGDKARRDRYRARHKGEDQKKWTPGWFAMKYLW